MYIICRHNVFIHLFFYREHGQFYHSVAIIQLLEQNGMTSMYPAKLVSTDYHHTATDTNLPTTEFSCQYYSNFSSPEISLELLLSEDLCNDWSHDELVDHRGNDEKRINTNWS